ncbi:hypothetical protein Bca52824_073878 [Brassica carinata]|uniref:Uncharacterized protein n=1 Tax=Brassica carinata TaxID=52824 RepID=A0A8X7QG40_BRACI|nr:hypothetical protein Bca52824_073878 [Brassica carinata]
MKKHRYVLVNINQAMDKSCYEEKPICRVKRAPNQKLILNHKLKTSIHQRACECCRVNLKSPWTRGRKVAFNPLGMYPLLKVGYINRPFNKPSNDVKF